MNKRNVLAPLLSPSKRKPSKQNGHFEIFCTRPTKTFFAKHGKKQGRIRNLLLCLCQFQVKSYAHYPISPLKCQIQGLPAMGFGDAKVFLVDIAHEFSTFVSREHTRQNWNKHIAVNVRGF